MKTVVLGSTGIEVTELCFGALPIGPMQKNIEVEDGSDTIAHALKSGVSFVDTAKMYATYPHIRLAIEKSGITPVISSKSTASGYEDMERDVHKALEDLNVDKIDIFFLHAARVAACVFDERRGALDALIDCKKKGLIRAIGLSTHNVKAVYAAAELPEIDVIFALINSVGMGVLDGSRQEMEQALERCFAANKGVMIMKALAGGNLIKDYIAAMDYARNLSKGRAAIALGMVNKSEVDMNVRYFNGMDISADASGLKAPHKEFFIMPPLCKKCGACLRGCHSSAISEVDGVMVIDTSKCLTCGYCVGECREFAIRMI